MKGLGGWVAETSGNVDDGVSIVLTLYDIHETSLVGLDSGRDHIHVS